MKDAAVEERVNPAALNKRTAKTARTVKTARTAETADTAGTASQQVEHPAPDAARSPPPKRRPPSEPCTQEPADAFEAAAAGSSREVNVLLSKFAKVLRERAAADASQMKELEGVLTEARNLESFLREKKSHLRQTLALISDKLQG